MSFPSELSADLRKSVRKNHALDATNASRMPARELCLLMSVDTYKDVSAELKDNRYNEFRVLRLQGTLPPAAWRRRASRWRVRTPPPTARYPRTTSSSPPGARKGWRKPSARWPSRDATSCYPRLGSRCTRYAHLSYKTYKTLLPRCNKTILTWELAAHCGDSDCH